MDFLIHHLLHRSAARLPDKDGLVGRDLRWSFHQFADRVARLGTGLREIGLGRHDRLGILLPPSADQALAILGCSQAGGVFVPIHHSLFPAQVQHIVQDCSVQGLVTDAPGLAKLTPALGEGTPVEFVVLVEGSDPETSGKPAYLLDELLTASAATRNDDLGTEKDLAAILYTSGSTGKPKGVMLSHANVIAGASIVSTYLQINERDRTLAALPFTFDAGLNQLMTAIQHGATLVIENWLFARDIVRLLDRERITGLAGVPPLWSLLAQDSSTLSKTDLPHLRYITNTGGAMNQSLLARLQAALPETDVVLMYGLTEAFRSTYLPPDELPRRPTSMGKAIPDTEILVVDEQGQRCEPGQVGELVHHGPTVSLGYWGQPELTRRVLRPHPFPPEGLVEIPRVVYSGDLVRMDEDGFLFFVGRRDNQIKCSGFRISPTEVEEVLCQSGSLREAAVIGVPDDLLGQRIKAFVTPRDDAPLDADELLAFCSAEMPRHMVPREVEVIAELPKTSSGKVDYPALRRREGLSA